MAYCREHFIEIVNPVLHWKGGLEGFWCKRVVSGACDKFILLGRRRSCLFSKEIINDIVCGNSSEAPPFQIKRLFNRKESQFSQLKILQAISCLLAVLGDV